MKSIYIFVDDERIFQGEVHREEYDVVTVRSYPEAIHWIDHCVEHHIGILLDLDHDLGTEKTGYDICKYVVENQISDVRYHIHSMNPVGRQNMDQLLSHYGYRRF